MPDKKYSGSLKNKGREHTLDSFFLHMYVQSLDREDTLEKEMATHSSILAWKIPGTEEPGRLYSPWGLKEMDRTECTEEPGRSPPALESKG